VNAAWLESLSEEMNYCGPGTEMFWNDHDGSEAILQVRVASLCSDERLIKQSGQPARAARSLVGPDRPNSCAKKSNAVVHPSNMRPARSKPSCRTAAGRGRQL
jgi:hypothetical protein